MTKEELIERLQGGYQKTLTGQIPADSISLSALADVLLSLMPEGSAYALKPGVTRTANGGFMRDGKFISKSEALV